MEPSRRRCSLPHRHTVNGVDLLVVVGNELLDSRDHRRWIVLVSKVLRRRRVEDELRRGGPPWGPHRVQCAPGGALGRLVPGGWPPRAAGDEKGGRPGAGGGGGGAERG